MNPDLSGKLSVSMATIKIGLRELYVRTRLTDGETQSRASERFILAIDHVNAALRRGAVLTQQRALTMASHCRRSHTN